MSGSNSSPFERESDTPSTSSPSLHDPGVSQGQNLASQSSEAFSGPDVLEMWVQGANESSAYNPNAPEGSHFTQVGGSVLEEVVLVFSRTPCWYFRSCGRAQFTSVAQKLAVNCPFIPPVTAMTAMLVRISR